MDSARRLLMIAPIAIALAEAAPAQAAGGGGKASQSSYLRAPALAATAPLAGGRRGVMTVEPGLDTPDPALRLRAEQSLPRLRAAWFRAVSNYANGMRSGQAPDADAIARTLQLETDKVLGRKGARLLLGSIIIS